MQEDLKRLAIRLGEAVHEAKSSLERKGADNETWKRLVKARCLDGIRSGLKAGLPPDVAVRFVETPYNSATIGRGDGRNEMACQIWGPARAARTLTILADIVDGSWNAACDLPFSASTMLALTGLDGPGREVDQLTLADFKCGIVVPLMGDVRSPAQARGFYYGIAGEPPAYRELASGSDHSLRPTGMEDVRQTRFFLDLFTAQTYDTLALSLEAVRPLIIEWADIGRFYGAGIELMSLLGRDGTTPGFGGYVAANQKADNLIPTKMLLEGAGVLVSDWWGRPIDGMRIMDRMYVAVGANRALHAHLVGHLSKTRRLP